MWSFVVSLQNRFNSSLKCQSMPCVFTPSSDTDKMTVWLVFQCDRRAPNWTDWLTIVITFVRDKVSPLGWCKNRNRLYSKALFRLTARYACGWCLSVMATSWYSQLHLVMATPRYGYIPLWIHPAMAASRYGYISLWLHSGMATFRYGYIPLWLHPVMASSRYGTPRYGYIPLLLHFVMATFRYGYIPLWLHSVWLFPVMDTSS